MLHFDALVYVNCIIESVVLLLLWTLLIRNEFPKSRYVIMFLCLGTVSALIASFETTLLLLNIVLLFVCGFCCFRKVGLFNATLYTLFSFLSLLYLQATLMWFFPKQFIESKIGNFAINSAVLAVVLLLSVLSKKYRWAEIYAQERGTVWLFLLLLCVPEILFMQIIVVVLADPNYLFMLSLTMLQLCYILALILAFLLHFRKQEKRRIGNIQNAIGTLNLYLEDSKKQIHDFNKHIHYLHSVIATQSTQPELKEAVDDYCRDILSLSEQEEIMLQLDDPVFRALIYRRQLQARAAGIPLILIASTVLPAFPLKEYQLVTVFDNLLDNAFECVEALPDEKWIKVSLQTVPLNTGKTRHILCVQNPFGETRLSSILGRKYCSTKGPEHQGLGLHNVAQTVSASGGEFLLNPDNSIFTAKIVYDLDDTPATPD